jgi:hypothetical protein
MLFVLALLVAVALVLIIGRLRISLRAYNEKHRGLRVIEVAFIVSRADQKAAELVVYITFKSAGR